MFVEGYWPTTYSSHFKSFTVSFSTTKHNFLCISLWLYILLAEVDPIEIHIWMEKHEVERFLKNKKDKKTYCQGKRTGGYDMIISMDSPFMLCGARCIVYIIMHTQSNGGFPFPLQSSNWGKKVTNKLVLETPSETDWTKSSGCQLLGRGKGFSFMILKGYCSINMLVCAP